MFSSSVIYNLTRGYQHADIGEAVDPREHFLEYDAIMQALQTKTCISVCLRVLPRGWLKDDDFEAQQAALEWMFML